MDFSQRLASLRQQMQQRGHAALIIPRADEHLGEYLPAHNERLLWATGFTGSAGMAVILADRAAIFVDGRYTVQVRQQVDGELFEYHHLIDEPPLAWLCAHLPQGASVLVDPRLHSLVWYRDAEAVLGKAGLALRADVDNPVDACWRDRPPAAVAEALLLGERWTGEHSLDKRRRIGRQLAEQGVDAALVFAPDSVSWLLNLRGRDVPCQPVLQSWCLLWADGSVDLVVNPTRLPAGVAAHVGEGLRVHAEVQGEALLRGQQGRRILADPATANAWTQLTLVQAGATLVEGADPVLLPKACKNAVEIAGMRAAHVRDGAALVRFLCWLDGQVAAGERPDEAQLAERLLSFRSEVEHFQGPSFDTISAAGANAAMCHYHHVNSPQPASLPADGVYLVDSGGQYLDGTTDVTRTVAIGAAGDEVRRLFTLVLKGHIALDQARFPRGTTGTHLDVLARQFLWREGHDFDHGTGHGVGAFLSVHEGPQRISRAWSPAALQPGMVISNEPGYYRDGAFGIRCENLVVVVPVEGALEKPMYGFDVLTLAPFDRRLVDTTLLTGAERDWLNSYHARVCRTLAPGLPADARAWLEAATAPL